MVPKTPQVATACFSFSPPDLNLLDPYFTFMYMHNNHCHRVIDHLQLNIIIIITTTTTTIQYGCLLSQAFSALYFS